jgi:pimeloyl-ACP methyl ester carboxylesterase
MVAVFVHGNPETPVVWDPLLAELGLTDAVALHLPGFGSPVPDGFGATKEEYAAWLAGELRSIVERSGPVDLVSHDWGGILAPYVVGQHPELVRSWASDALGIFHPDYVWHDFAQIWQTPGAGEEFFAQTMATPVEDRIAGYEAIGIPRETGTQLVAASDELMSTCILALYRSAAQPEMARWGTLLDGCATRPGLSVFAPNDPFVRGHDLAAQVAERLGARRVEMVGQGHWWMLGDPAGAAAMLREFWGSL